MEDFDNYKTMSDVIYENRNNIKETAKLAKQLLEKFYKMVFNKEIEFTIQEEIENEEYLVQSDKADIEIFVQKGNGEEVIFFYPEGIIYCPGVWRYADGSGEPPSSDVFDLVVEDHTSLVKAVEVAIKYLYDRDYSYSLDNFSEYIGLEPIEENSQN